MSPVVAQGYECVTINDCVKTVGSIPTLENAIFNINFAMVTAAKNIINRGNSLMTPFSTYFFPKFRFIKWRN